MELGVSGKCSKQMCQSQLVQGLIVFILLHSKYNGRCGQAVNNVSSSIKEKEQIRVTEKELLPF